MGIIRNAIENFSRADIEYYVDLKIRERKEKYYIQLFDDEKWTVELTVDLLEKSSNDSNQLVTDRLLNNIYAQIMENFNLRLKNEQGKVKKVDPNDFKWEHSLKFGNIISILNSRKEKEVIFLTGEGQSGKTSAIHQFCKTHEGEATKFFWLDFNGGFINFVNTFVEILNTPKEDYLYIIIDNIECCGKTHAQNIFEFFLSFVKNIRKIGEGTPQYAQLLILQDEKYKLDYKLTDDNCIRFIRRNICSELISNDDSANKSHDSLFFMVNETKQLSEANVKANFLSIDTIKEPKELNLLFKILLLSCYGIKVKLNETESTVVCSLINKTNCIKVFRNTKYSVKAVSSSKELSYSLIEYIKENWSTREFFKCFNSPNVEFKEAVNKIIEEYYNNSNSPMNITDFDNVLQTNTYAYYKRWDEHNHIRDFMELIGMANEFKERIIREIDKSTETNGKYFDNHLGAILFAAEALTMYSDEWDALAAWTRLAKYVRDTFYIKGQRLPERRTGREDDDSTYTDFVTNKETNSIKNQIDLQNEVLTQSGRDLFGSLLQNEDNLENILSEDNYRFVLTEEQCKDGDIDINRFYGTYILALLFEFEVTAPIGQRNENRIKTLFEKIKLNIIEKEEAAYFYPARVPWVTARMLLALCLYAGRDSEILGCIADYKIKITRWLSKCAYSIDTPMEGTPYKIWTPGTGLWNTIIDTTMMCTFALKKAGVSSGNPKIAYDEGCNYLLAVQNEWFKGYNSIADGIWACETIWLNTNQTDVLQSASDVLQKLKSFDNIFVENSNKLDRSLGNTHVAKTLISFVYELCKGKPDIFTNRAELFDVQKKHKAFISFKTEDGDKTARATYQYLKAKLKCLPYIYTEDMRRGNWRKQLENAIKQSDTFILVVSDEVFNSEPVLEEIRICLQADIKVLPIVCTKTGKFPEISPLAAKKLDGNILQKLNAIIGSDNNYVSIEDNFPEKVAQYLGVN